MKQLFTESRGGTTLALGAPIGGPSGSERSTADLGGSTGSTSFGQLVESVGGSVCGPRRATWPCTAESLAAVSKGDALTHGPYLVAWPVGSQWEPTACIMWLSKSIDSREAR